MDMAERNKQLCESSENTMRVVHTCLMNEIYANFFVKLKNDLWYL